MSEATPETTAQDAPEATSQEGSTSTPPPWGEDFDAGTAWDALQKARREAQNLRQRVGPTPEQQQQLDEYNRLVEASKSEAQRQSEALEAANRDRERYQSEALRYRVAAEHGIGKDDLDLLGSGTEEELVTRAQRIASLRSAAAPAQAAPTPGQRPVEQLRPGATPSGVTQSEEDKLYSSLFPDEAR